MSKQNSNKTKVKEEVPLVETETVDENVANKKAPSKKPELTTMSPDKKVDLAVLLQKRFKDDPEAKLKYSQEVLNEQDNLIDAIAMMAVLDLRDEAISKGVNINLSFNGRKAFEVVESLKMLGINLHTPKLLGDGQSSLEFKDADIDKTIGDAVEHEKKAKKQIEEEIPELDPTKITTDEQVVLALEYLMRNGVNAIQNLINTIEWLRSFENFKADTADKKLALEDRTISDWINDILSKIKPTLLLTGIGRSVYINAAVDGTPLGAHVIVRKNSLGEDGKPILNEQQIAEVVVTLLKQNALFALKNEPEKMKGKTVMDDKALKALFSGNESLIEKFMSKEEAVDKKIYSMVLKSYFPSATDTGNMSEKMHNKLGQLMNLYLPVTERMEAYSEITEEQEFPAKEDVKQEETTVEEKKK